MQMSQPGAAAYCFAGLMLVVAVSSAARLVLAGPRMRATHGDVDLAHLLMAVAMVGMLVARWSVLSSVVWRYVFLGMIGWLGWRCLQFVRARRRTRRDGGHVHRLSHHVTHLVMAVGMLTMYLPGGTGQVSGHAMGMVMSAASSPGSVRLSVALLLVLAGSAGWELTEVAADRVRRGASRARPSAGRLAVMLPQPRQALAGQRLLVGAVGGGWAPPVASAVCAQAAAVAVPQARLEASRSVGADHDRRWFAPRLQAACHVAMVVTMGYMLVVMR